MLITWSPGSWHFSFCLVLTLDGVERHGFLTGISILASSLSLVNGYLVLLKGTDTYETVIRSVMSFIGREYLNISEINVAFLTNMLNI